MAGRRLFVTGKLAAPALRDALGRSELPFDYDVAVMKITVAALMTTNWIAKFLEVPDGVTKIMIPGLCEGETDVLAEATGVAVEKGPPDLKALPTYFGQADARAAYGERDIRVFAEINHVPRLSRHEILAEAERFREEGADVIDLGLSLGRRWLDDGPETIAAQLMHFAVEQGTPPKHVDGRLVTLRDDELRPYSEAELRELHEQVTDPNFRIFADADWIYVFNADVFVKGTDFNEIFDQLGVDEATHAFYLGKELMKATIARALRKNYRQESPLDWGYMTFVDPKRERVKLTAKRGKGEP